MTATSMIESPTGTPARELVEHTRTGVTAPARPPIRVCFVIDRLVKAGTEGQLLTLINSLDRRRFSPYLCLLYGQDDASRALEPTDIPILRLEARGFRSPSIFGKAKQFVRLLRRERIDIVSAYLLDSTYFAVPLARLAGVKAIVRNRRNMGYWMRPWLRVLGALCNRATTVTVANCEACRGSLLADEGPDPNRVVVIENGLDLRALLAIPPFVASTPRERNEGTRRVGIVANLRPVKALDVFLDAVAKVARTRSDVRFAIAGDGPLRAELRSRAETLGIADRVDWMGSCADVRPFLATLDVAVLCSHSEGLSNSVIEYMAAARPIVATTVGGNVDLIQDNDSGLLVPPGEAGALATAIGRMLDDPATAERCAAKARAEAARRFELSIMTARYEGLFTSLVPRD